MKKLLSLILVFAIAAALPSCAKVTPSPSDIVSALSAAEASLPNGMLYSSDAKEGEDAYLPPEMLSAAYGFPADFDGLVSAAIRLSSFCHPVEFAVFLCRSDNAAEDVALFCRVRLETLKSSASDAAAFCGMPADEYLSYLSHAAVIISGRHVALIVSSDPTAARRAFCSAL